MKALMRCVWAIVVVLGMSSVQAAEVTDNFRLSPIHIEPGFSGNYLKDAATVRNKQLRLEFSGMSIPNFLRVDHTDHGTEVRIYDFIASYGLLRNAEVGFDVPVIDLVPEDRTLGSQVGVGDVSLYGKYKLLHTENLSLTGGFEAQIDTSDENSGVLCGPGTGTLCQHGFQEPGFNPFGAFRFQQGPIAFGGHVGYEIFSDPLGDVLNYDINTIFAVTDALALRIELTGLNQMKGRSQDILAVSPGVDLVLGALTFRAAGFKGITDDSVDWGLGGGAALTLFGAPEPPPPAPVAAAPAPTPEPAPPPPVKKKIVLRSVHFDFDKADIRADAEPILNEAAEALKEEGEVKVVVKGHTDSVGSEEYNQQLSLRRAKAVMKYLVDHGVDASRITAEGFGETQPVASNDTSDGRDQNRRVELQVD